MSLRVQAHGHPTLDVDVDALLPVECLTFLFACHANPPRSFVVLKFDGEDVDPRRTPAELELEDGDLLDAFVRDPSRPPIDELPLLKEEPELSTLYKDGRILRLCVIFIDVDGVLHTRGSKCDPRLLQELKSVVAATGAWLVLSTAWRR